MENIALLPEHSITSTNVIHCMDALRFLQILPDNYVNCIVTSPPYWGLRDYGVDGQIGLEDTMQDFIQRIVVLFREARRVLREDGTLWLNLGDSYASDTKWSGHSTGKNGYLPGGYSGNRRRTHMGLKHKDLCGIPWRVALALQDDGWYLRSDIIWHKPNPMPESVRDRPSKAHEYIFLLTKSAKYWYDANAIQEPLQDSSVQRLHQDIENQTGSVRANGGRKSNGNIKAVGDVDTGRNKRTVWTVATQSYSEAHFATYPITLIDPCIKAGCPPKVCIECGTPWKRIVEHEPMIIRKTDRTAMGRFGRTQSSGTMISPAKTTFIGWQSTCDCHAESHPGIVLDPFMGAGTTALASILNERDYIGCDLNPEYVQMARQRIHDTDFAETSKCLGLDDNLKNKVLTHDKTQLGLFA